jgi:hypothetical protein
MHAQNNLTTTLAKIQSMHSGQAGYHEPCMHVSYLYRDDYSVGIAEYILYTNICMYLYEREMMNDMNMNKNVLSRGGGGVFIDGIISMERSSARNSITHTQLSPSVQTFHFGYVVRTLLSLSAVSLSSLKHHHARVHTDGSII